jgi:hypothetical protein
MSYSEGYEYKQVFARVGIQGFGEVAATSVNVTYGINTFPTAVVELAVGREASGGQASAPGVASLQAYRRTIAIDVSLDGEISRIFFGYVTGVSNKKSSGRFGIVVSAVSWFSDLANGSPFASGLTRNAGLADLSVPVALPDMLSDRPASTWSWIGFESSVGDYLAGGNVGETIVELMRAITTGGSNVNGIEVQNEAAAAAVGATEASLTLKNGDDIAVKTGIGNALAASIFTVFNGASLFEAVLRSSVELGYIIVPAVEKMFIIPWIPVNSTPTWYINDTRIVSTSNSFGVSPALQTLALVNQEEMSTLAGVSGGQLIRAQYTNPAVTSGMFDIAPVPSWLVNIIDGEDTAGTMTLSDGIRARCAQPKQQGEKVAEGEELADIGKKLAASAPALNTTAAQYAQFLYGLKSIRNTAVIQTPISFRIGPGTTARFNLGADIGELDGYINAVSFTFDSERHSAIQEHKVTHMRSSGDSAIIGTDGSPLWSEALGVDVIASATVGGRE